MTRVALCIGVDRYDDPQINPLSCAQTDAAALYGLFRYRLGFDRYELLHAPDDDAILNAAERLTRGLGAGDQFVFTFSGHGFEHPFNGCNEHLLLCPGAKLTRLAFAKHALPVSLLKDETARPGLERLFVIDACRSPLQRQDTRDAAAGTGMGAGGMQGTVVLRDLVVRANRQSDSPLTLFCACEEGEQASELPSARQGLFTLGLVESLEQALAEGGAPLRLDSDFAARVAAAMQAGAQRHGIAGKYRPWFQGGGLDLAPPVAPRQRPPQPTPQPTPQAEPAKPAAPWRSDPLALLKPARDVFETEDEFAARRQRLLAEYQMAVERAEPAIVAGSATLQRAAYDIARQRFPVTLDWQDWAQGLHPDGLEAIEVDRDAARALWEEGPRHDLVLPVVDGQIGASAWLLGLGRHYALVDRPQRPLQGPGDLRLEHPLGYAKLDAQSRELGDAAGEWSMVLDVNTGLMWEHKTDDGGLRDKGNDFTWYDPNSPDGNPGKRNGGQCTGGIECDTHAYVQAVNAAKLGGYTDWRLPTREELKTLVAKDQPEGWKMQPEFFADQPEGGGRNGVSGFWSASVYANFTDYAWLVNFDGGNDGWYVRSAELLVRLVREGQ